MASGLAVGISLLLGLALGPVSLLVLVPVTIALNALYRASFVRPLLTIITVASIGILRSATIGDAPDPAFLDDTDQAVGVVSRVPVAGGEFERTLLSIERVRSKDGPWRAGVGDTIAYFPDRGEGVSLRDRVFVIWEITPLSDLEPGYAGYVRGQGAVASAWVYAYSVEAQGPSFFEAVGNVRRALSRDLVESFPGDAGALASGIVTGDDSAMTDRAMDAFRRTGTAHVTAVSGQNVSLLIGFLSLWMRPRSRWTRLASHVAMVAAVWLFALMVGMEAPALRASIVATMTIAGAWSGRRPDPLTLVALSLGAMAFISPVVIGSVGFWLSAAASLALCSVVPLDAPDGLAAKVAHLAIGPLAATLATLPIIVWTFGEWSPVSPIANAALAPVMTVLFPITYVFALVSMIPGPLPGLVAWLPGIGLDLALSVVDRMSRIAPQLQLDAAGPGVAVMVGIPAFLLLLAWSRDGERWLRVAASRI